MSSELLNKIREDFQIKYAKKSATIDCSLTRESIREPDENPFRDNFTSNQSEQELREQLAANPHLKALAKEFFGAGLIPGLRNISIRTHKQAKQEWDAQPGFIQMHPVMPPRKNGGHMNENTECRFHYSCSHDVCVYTCNIFKELQADSRKLGSKK